jgi:Cys-tRNA(Pro)/Cys-tRNA(Cys) deacylase
MAKKTNAVRLVSKFNFPVTEAFYDYDENDLNGMHAAEALNLPPVQVFKTLVARGTKNGIAVFCIPVCCELDLKRAAAALGDKSVVMLPVKELLSTTGYIRGGCSPVGMKKQFPTFIDETAVLYDEIAVSAGVRGFQMILPTDSLIDFVTMSTADLTKT